MESLSDQWPAHGASRQRQAALFVPSQTPAEAPQLPGQCQQQDRGEKRSERGGQGRQHSKLRQGQHLLRAGPFPSIHLCLRAEIVWAVRKASPCPSVRNSFSIPPFSFFFLWSPVKAAQIKTKGPGVFTLRCPRNYSFSSSPERANVNSYYS